VDGHEDLYTTVVDIVKNCVQTLSNEDLEEYVHLYHIKIEFTRLLEH